MRHTQTMNATLLYKAAQAVNPEQDDKFIKRRRLLARVIPALLLGAYGGVAGRAFGKTQDAWNQYQGGEPSNNALKDMLIGGLGGAAIGYGGGALSSRAKEWAGADPLLNSVALSR